MTKTLEQTAVTDSDHLTARVLTGWRPRVYRLQPEPLRVTRRYLELAPGVSTQETRLLSGGVRIDGHVGAGTLKIGFVRSKEIRILGACVKEPFIAVACGGSRLNFSASLPGSALTLHFDGAAATRSIAPEMISLPAERLLADLPPRTFLRPMTRLGDELERVLRRLLARASHEGVAPPAPEAAHVVETSARLMEELMALKEEATAPSRRRRELALVVESLLWEAPEAIGRLSLDDAAKRLKCSRRSIQLALQEEFGLGFVALKRSIRLQQVHAILRCNPEGAAGIGRIAKAHDFNHLGRFAGHYRDMFGVLPSLDRSELAGAI